MTQPVGGGGVRECPPALVAVPFLVDLGIVTGQAPQYFSAPMVGALGAAGRTVFADARRRHQVERAGPEPVRGAGQGADRADLHGVAGEIRFERLVDVGADLLQRTTIGQIDQRVAGDLIGESGAAGA